MSATDGMRADRATKDFYAELGVKKDAGADELTKAYRKLAHANPPAPHPRAPATPARSQPDPQPHGVARAHAPAHGRPRLRPAPE